MATSLGVREAENSQEGGPPSLWSTPALPTPGSQTSGLRNWERIRFCSLRPPVCGALLWEPQEANVGGRRGRRGQILFDPPPKENLGHV